MTLGPTEPLSTGSSTDLPVSLSVKVMVPLDAATFVLSPSMDAPQSLRPQAVARSRRENKPAIADYQTAAL